MLPMVTGVKQPSGHSPNMLPIMTGIQPTNNDRYQQINSFRVDTLSPNTLDEFHRRCAEQAK